MTPFVLRPFFIRSTLILGWIAGGVFALLAARHVPSSPVCATAPQIAATEVMQPNESIDEPVSLTEIDDDHEDALETFILSVTESSPGCVYYSSFEDGEVQLAPNTKSAVFQRDFSFEDGCEWRSEERLEQIDGALYRYDYREKAVSCPKGVHPATACTRHGNMVSEKID